jgi:iron-sulfur cluster repair protein YtfE (RIC family)
MFYGGREFTRKRRCAMATITGDMVINEVIRKYPATIKVFNDYRVDSCCGGGAPIEVTARRDGVDVDGLVRALNAAAEGEVKK